jgi:GNAT superfamily N-acetyltransferase
MDSTYKVTLEAEPKPGDMNAIVHGLLAFNGSHTGGATPRYLVVTLRDDDGNLVGGLVGAIYLGWLSVHALWLPEELRGRGYGGALLDTAEQEAVRSGCPKACLETLSFQARDFYEKRGYVTFATLLDMPPGGAKYFLAKTLRAKTDAA